jgi:F0F1-type ATP synthase delta subunit
MNSKHLKKIIEKLVQNSFSDKGEIKTMVVLKNLNLIKKLSVSDALVASKLYQKGLKREMSKTTLDIFTPSPISPLQKKQIIELAGKQNTINNVNVSIDPSLLGGLRIKIGDVVFSDTVLDKIAQIKGAING